MRPPRIVDLASIREIRSETRTRREYDCGCVMEVTMGKGPTIRRWKPCKGHTGWTEDEFHAAVRKGNVDAERAWRSRVSYRCANGEHHLCSRRRRGGSCGCDCHVPNPAINGTGP